MKRSFAIACICLSFQGAAGWSALSQDKKTQPAQIETQKDRFSGATTIKLNTLYLFKKPNQKLALSLEVKIDPKKPNESDAVFASFISYTQSPYDFGDRELHFLVDGTALSIGRANRGDLAILPGSAETLLIGISLKKLDQITGGKMVEMRLGSIESQITEETLATLREFVRAAKSAYATPK